MSIMGNNKQTNKKSLLIHRVAKLKGAEKLNIFLVGSKYISITTYLTHPHPHVV